MHELIAELLSYVRGTWRFRWRILLVAWPVALAGWFYVLTMPNQYEASAKVFVDTETALKPLLEDLTVQADMLSEVRTMTAALLSRGQLERVARETDLYLRANTELEMESLINGLRENISVGGGADSLYTIGYQDTDREMAVRVVGELLEAFVGESLGANRDGSEDAKRFLTQQIEEYAIRLTASEDRLAEFKKRNFDLMPGSAGDYYERLQDQMSDLEETRVQLRVALNRRDVLRRQIEGEEPTFGIVSPSGAFLENNASDETAQRIQAMRDTRSQLLLRFTESHPDVVALDETIARLEAERSESTPTPSLSGSTSERPLELNPVYQNMRIALNEADLQVATLQSSVREKQTAVANLRAAVDTIPEVEAELTRLNRDYEVIREKHQALTDSLEAAKLSQEADKNKRVNFRIIEPASVPLEPSGPFRGLFMFMVLAGAVGLGLGTAFLFHLLRPVFDSAQSIRKFVDLPVIGQIDKFVSLEDRKTMRRDTTLFGVAAAALFVVFTFAVAFQALGHDLLASFLDRLSA